MPREDRDLVISASNSWLLVFDNLSAAPAWFSDGLCRLATGSGYATRMLHTDREEMIFDGIRPSMMNGISQLTDAPDLGGRALNVHLCAIPEERRRCDVELWAEFEEAWPRIMGGLFDGVSAALRNYGKVRLGRAPRMADFVKWIVAAEGGLGWESGVFLDIYEANQRDVADAAFEADAIAVAIQKLVTLRGGRFEDTPTVLLASLNDVVEETIRKSKYWPANATQLGSRVTRATPLFKVRGWKIERRHSGARTITIVAPPERES
jgi:hypothetical protein